MMKVLEGKKIILTQSDSKTANLSALLKQSGASVFNLPMIEISYSNTDEIILKAIQNLHSYNLIVFTSKHGVSAFFHHLKNITGSYKINHEIEFAVIGNSTGKQLSEFGCNADYVNTGTTSEDFLNYLLENKIPFSKRILLPAGNLAPDYLINELKKITFAERINVYETMMPKEVDKEIANLVNQNDVDMIVFSSPSAFNNFKEYFSINKDYKIPILSTGKTTTSAIEAMGFKVKCTSKDASVQSINDEIIKFFSIKKEVLQ